MSDPSGAPECPTPKSRSILAPNWLVLVLLAVIAANELQRTWAQAEAHRQRIELSISMAELNRKMDWLLTTQRPTATAIQLRPPVVPASSEKRP